MGKINLDELRAKFEPSNTIKAYTVVRLKTEYYQKSNGELVLAKSIKTMKRLSDGLDMLAEEVSNVGAEDFLKLIVNLNDCEDGLYHISITNISKDIETGYLDDFDFILLPYKE